MKQHDEDTIEYENGEIDASEIGGKMKKLHDELKKCEALQKEYLDGWQRAKADFINYKKDEGKRFDGFVSTALRDIMHDLIVVLDSFHLAKNYDMPKHASEGFSMIQGQLEDALRKRGLSIIHVRSGDPFNPEIHESIGEVEIDLPEGSIAEEVQKGYTLHGVVIRPSRVKLAKSHHSM